MHVADPLRVVTELLRAIFIGQAASYYLADRGFRCFFSNSRIAGPCSRVGVFPPANRPDTNGCVDFQKQQVAFPIERRTFELETFVGNLEPRACDDRLQAFLRRRNRRRPTISLVVAQPRRWPINASIISISGK
jgi:hypothetical protein